MRWRRMRGRAGLLTVNAGLSRLILLVVLAANDKGRKQSSNGNNRREPLDLPFLVLSYWTLTLNAGRSTFHDCAENFRAEAQ